MTVWESSFNGAFWITIATLLIGAVSLAFKYCLKSKCKDINICFGCLKINRNVDLEQEEEIRAMELGIPENNIEEQKNNL